METFPLYGDFNGTLLYGEFLFFGDFTRTLLYGDFFSLGGPYGDCFFSLRGFFFIETCPLYADSTSW